MEHAARQLLNVSKISLAYCERDHHTGIDLHGEPLNFYSNFVQIFIGIAYCIYLRDKKNLDVNLIGGILYILVGVGSAIWHSVGLPATYVLDLAIPFFFIAWYGYNWAFRVIGVRSVPLRFLVVFSLLGLMGLLAAFHESPLISVHWAWYTVLCGGAVVHSQVSKWKRWRLLQAAGLYAIGLFFYAADRQLCTDNQPGYQPGFHWLWHLFSAAGGMMLLVSLPPEDYFVAGHQINPWSCQCLKKAAVHPDRESAEAKVSDKIDEVLGNIESKLSKASAKEGETTEVEDKANADGSD